MDKFQLSFYDNCGNKLKISSYVEKLCPHMTDVEKSEILHIWHVCDVDNVAIYAKFMQNLPHSCGEKLSPKVYLWSKNDKYEVWVGTTLLALYTGCSQKSDFLKLPEACLFVVELAGMQLFPVHKEHLVNLEQFHVAYSLDGRLRTGFQQFQRVTFLERHVLLFLCSLV